MSSRRRNGKSVGGFVTIEYTLLIPVLLVLYTFLICMGLYQYNSCILRTNISILGTEGAQLAKDSATTKLAKLKEKEAQLYYDKYLLAIGMQTTYSIQGDRIEIIGEGQMTNPLTVFGIGEENWQLSAVSERIAVDPTEVLRLSKTLYKAAQEILVEEEQEDGS